MRFIYVLTAFTSMAAAANEPTSTITLTTFPTPAPPPRFPPEPLPDRIQPINPKSGMDTFCAYLRVNNPGERGLRGGGWWCENGTPDIYCDNYVWRHYNPFYVCVGPDGADDDPTFVPVGPPLPDEIEPVNPRSGLAAYCSYLRLDKSGGGKGWWCADGYPDSGCMSYFQTNISPYYVCVAADGRDVEPATLTAGALIINEISPKSSLARDCLYLRRNTATENGGGWRCKTYDDTYDCISFEWTLDEPYYICIAEYQFGSNNGSLEAVR
ncbi:hypothetical protein HYFRA_00011550 [Hymenoscyphus fraxineus]|uniref:Uncharacterized protein n=1 Tax=Hymenoscyphus fraxineus TaxID=746836 RepID=A0A9N9L5Z1_9HELO|nr:hypothetical protein HYFRA_00011550 [Hymenoscyphus fraxineus]